MKKYFSSFFLLVSLLSFGFVSCGDKPDGPDGPDDGKDSTVVTPPVDFEKVTADDYTVKCAYFGEVDGAHKFTISLQDRDVLQLFGQIIGGSGDVYSLEIYSETQKDMIPAMTKYAIGDTKAPYMAKGTGKSGSAVLVVDEEKAPQGTPAAVKSGSVTMAKDGANYRIDIDIKLSDGTARAISYTGVMETVDAGPYSMENSEIIQFEITNPQVEITGGAQLNPETDVASLNIYGSNGEGEIWLLVPKGEKNLAHEYKFSSSGEAWTAYASPGAVNGAPHPSYVAKVMNIYFLTDGTVSVDASGNITVDAKTAKGSTFKMSYNKK